MSILSGYGKFKRYVLTDSGYKLCSQWTSSNTVHFDDGNTAQTKVGAINGITDSLTATSSNIALSAAAGKSLQDQVTQLNTGLAWQYINLSTIVSVDSKYATIKDVWPSNACKCGNLIQLDLALNILTPPAGNYFIQIHAPYIPANPTYSDMAGGVLINIDGGCGGWIGQGDLFLHFVYVINPA